MRCWSLCASSSLLAGSIKSGKCSITRGSAFISANTGRSLSLQGRSTRRDVLRMVDIRHLLSLCPGRTRQRTPAWLHTAYHRVIRELGSSFLPESFNKQLVDIRGQDVRATNKAADVGDPYLQQATSG